MSSTHQEKYSVAIIIPCRNEKGNLESLLRGIPAFGSCQEIILVEGHSTDGTYEECQRLMAQHPEKAIKLLRQNGEGKNDAVQRGFQEARSDILMIFDADMTTSPGDLVLFYEALSIGRGDFINGTRLVLPMESQAMPVVNFIGNKISAFFFSWLLGQRFTDTLCGVKAMFRKDYQRIDEHRKYFGADDPWGDFDLLLGAARLGLRIMEVPVSYKARKYGVSQIKRWYHTLALIKLCALAVWKIKIRAWR